MISKTRITLIFLILITIVLGLGVVSATNNTDLTDTTDLTDSKSQISNTNVINEGNDEIHSDVNINENENKINTADNTKKASTLKANDATTINVNNYGELYDQVITLRNKGTAKSYTINLNKGDYTITDTLIWGTYNGPARNLTINGNGATINGKGTKSFLTINTNYTVTLNNLNIINNFRTNVSGGGAIFANGDLTINNCNFTNCKTTDSAGHTNTHGGAIRASNAKVCINNSIFKQNSATAGAGAVVVFTTSTISSNVDVSTITPTLFISNSQFINNSAQHAGAVNLEEYIAANITNCTFTSNNAVDGGAINTDERSYLISTNNKFISNTANKTGAAIYIGIGAKSKIDKNTFTSNTAATSGAGIINQESSTLIISDSTFTKNKVTGSNGAGGAIANTKKVTATITNCTFNNNTATVYGGTISNVENNKITITNSKINNSKSNKNGGAIYNDKKNNLVIKNTAFTSNTADTAGGAIAAINDNTITITDSSFNNNIAKQHGGAIFTQNKTTLTIKNTSFTSNTANSNGGVLYTGTYANITAINTTFNKNKATGLGGAICSGTGSNITLTNSQFNNNNAGNTGHAIFNPAQSTLIFKGNTFLNTVDANIANSTIKNNGIIKNETINTKISITSVEGSSDLEIKGKLIDEYNTPLSNQTVTVKVGNNTKTAKTDTDGNYVVNYSNLATGTYKITATFNKNSRYNAASANTTKTIKLINTKISITSVEGATDLEVKGKLIDEYNAPITNENVIVKVGNNTKTVKTDTDGNYIATYSNITNGTYKITATFNKNSKYNAASANTTKTIKIIPKIFINSMNVLSGKYVLTTKVTNYDYTKLTNGRVSYTLDGKWVGSVDVTDGSSWISFTTPAVGNHTIVATYIDANGKQAASDKYTFEKRAKVNALWNAFNVKNGKVIVITTVKDDQGNNITNGRVSYSLNNKWIGSIDVKNGSSWINFNYNDTTVSFKATYISGSNVTQSIYNRTLNLTELKGLANETGGSTPSDDKPELKNSSVHIMINSINVLNGKYVLTTKVTNDKYVKLNVGRVSYTLDGKWVGSVDVTDGSSWISFDVPAVGNHKLVATYVDANGKAITTDTYTFEKKANVNALFNAYDVKNDKIVIVTVVKDDKGNNITTGRVSYNLNNKWIGTINVKSGSSWINFNNTNNIVTFKATYINSNDVTQNIYTRTLDLDEIAKLRKV